MCLACLRQPAQRWHSSVKTLTNYWWEKNACVEIVSIGRRWEMSEQWAQNCLDCAALSTNMKWRKKTTSCLFSSIKYVVLISSYIVICSYFMTYLLISGLFLSISVFVCVTAKSQKYINRYFWEPNLTLKCVVLFVLFRVKVSMCLCMLNIGQGFGI